MNRTWDENRHHRDRVIRKRIKLVLNVFIGGREIVHDGMVAGRHRNQLSKDNLSCQCVMCRKPRYDRRRDRWDDSRAA